MQNRYTLPLISALVVSALLASCQRKAEEATTPAEEIVFTVASASQTKSCAAETSPVAIPVKSDGGEDLTLEVSSCPWMVEEPSTPATKVTPSDASYFSGEDHNSFGVMTYSASSEYAAAAARTKLWEDEVEYNDVIWAPSPSQAWPFAGNYLMFFCWAPCGAVTPEDNNNSGVPTISDFTVNENATDQVDLLVSKVIRTDSPSLSAPVPITFGHALTAVRFIGVRLTINSVTISGIYDKGSYNMDTGEWSSLSNQDQTYSSASYVTDEEYTLMLIPQTLPAGATLTAETSAGTITASLAGQEWEPGKAVTYKLTAPAASFSVSDTLSVRFSPGNLQAVFANAGSTFHWKFADNQWDYVGGRTEDGSETETGNNFINGRGSVSAAGTVDLFGWSASTNTSRGINNNKGNSDYYGDFRDWGRVVASTLGSGWRTLSRDEWTYLLDTRGGGAEDYPRYCKATVNDVPGLVIFPDDYSHPSGVTPPASVNTPDAAFNTGTWSRDAWTKMESAGCVFLPAAGLRDGTSVSDVGSDGNYWSSTPGGTIYAYCLRFYISAVNPSSDHRHFGFSVRLVKNL